MMRALVLLAVLATPARSQRESWDVAFTYARSPPTVTEIRARRACPDLEIVVGRQAIFGSSAIRPVPAGGGTDKHRSLTASIDTASVVEPAPRPLVQERPAPDLDVARDRLHFFLATN